MKLKDIIKKSANRGEFTFVACLLLVFLALVIPTTVLAHEAYVEPRQYFWHIMSEPPDPRVWEAFQDPSNIFITIKVVAGVMTFLILNFLFRLSRWGKKLHASLEKFSMIGPQFVRAAIVASFFFSAATMSFLGPELRLELLPAHALIQIGLFACAVLIFFGLFTEIAAFLALIIFFTGFLVYSHYLFTYFNYLGEIVVLLFFGMRRLSLDRLIFGKLRGWRECFEPYETTVVRVFYGIALIYAAVTVKFLHPDILIKVIHDWDLTQFHWLFPSDPVLITLGAGIIEVVIGLFIIFGFELRSTVLISLFYITLSLIYFKEMVWPHFMLYGISLNLLVQPEIFTIDNLIFDKSRKRLWRFSFKKHRGDAKC